MIYYEDCMPDISVKFGKCVRAIRVKKKISQGGLARILGVHPTYISSKVLGHKNVYIFSKKIPLEEYVKFRAQLT